MISKTTMKNIIILLLIACASSVFAQTEDCELTLGKAEDEFTAGHFYIIPSLLNNCLSSFSKEQRQRAYVLLSETYLLLDDPIGAKQSYLQLLNANPEFLPDTATHPIDLIYLSRRFTSTAIFSWYAKIGSNVSPIRVIYDRDAFGQSDAKEEYSLMAGYHAGIGGDYYLTEKIGARAELNFILTGFKHASSNYFNSTLHGTSDRKEVTNRQSWISLPLMMTFSDDLGKYRPYAYAGYAFHYLLTDRANIITMDQKPGSSETVENNQESPTYDFIYKRNRFNQSILAGGGLKVKVGLDFLFVDVRYTMGLKNIVNPKGDYGDYEKFSGNEQLTSTEFLRTLEPIAVYSHVEDYFRMDNFSISFGFIRPLYKPRELKNARTKSVLRRMK
jgi:hypothetical protein